MTRAEIERIVESVNGQIKANKESIQELDQENNLLMKSLERLDCMEADDE